LTDARPFTDDIHRAAAPRIKVSNGYLPCGKSDLCFGRDNLWLLPRFLSAHW